MTRYVMVADLRRCVGCQTCTAACKLANGTPPGVQWRRVVDKELGEYPNVKRVFVPTGCQHCSNPPCLEVCPSGATWQRGDGIVCIDYELCIGCAHCALACPYGARYVVEEEQYAYEGKPTKDETVNRNKDLVGVASKCNFCVDVIDAGLAKGLTPGEDAEATPRCVNSCISGAMAFGDIDDAESTVSRLLRDTKYYRLKEENGTEPGFYYIWDEEEA
jgi:phenylacetyl-CoA:acceptor oxidoreductase subunit 1